MNTTEENYLQSFAPICGQQASVLILGSMPGVRSLQKKQYYGHPRNAFWPIMGELFGAKPELEYEQRKAKLARCGVAVWDVLKQCQRQGSLDSAIARHGQVCNDFNRFFNDNSRVTAVFFNGAASCKLYRKLVLPQLSSPFQSLHYQQLPSTSPAYAAMSLAQKTARWQVVKKALENAR